MGANAWAKLVGCRAMRVGMIDAGAGPTSRLRCGSFPGRHPEVERRLVVSLPR